MQVVRNFGRQSIIIRAVSCVFLDLEIFRGHRHMTPLEIITIHSNTFVPSRDQVAETLGVELFWV